MRKFNIFLIIYFSFLLVLLIIIKGWEVLIRIMNTFGSNSLASLFGNFILLGIGLFATLWIFVVVLFGCGSASSEKYEDLDLVAYASPNKLNKTEYIVVERGVLAATTIFYHERHNLFLMKKKESYSHKI